MHIAGHTSSVLNVVLRRFTCRVVHRASVHHNNRSATVCARFGGRISKITSRLVKSSLWRSPRTGITPLAREPTVERIISGDITRESRFQTSQTTHRHNTHYKHNNPFFLFRSPTTSAYVCMLVIWKQFYNITTEINEYSTWDNRAWRTRASRCMFYYVSPVQCWIDSRFISTCLLGNCIHTRLVLLFYLGFGCVLFMLISAR